MKKTQMIKSIYDVVTDSGLTSHKFKDDDWSMIWEVRDTINRFFLQKGETISCYFSGVAGYVNFTEILPGVRKSFVDSYGAANRCADGLLKACGVRNARTLSYYTMRSKDVNGIVEMILGGK